MGYVYIFKNTETNQYKVGSTKREPTIRLKESETFNATNLILFDFFESPFFRQIENSLHKHYKRFNINREWFYLDFETLQKFKTLCKKIENGFTTLYTNLDE